MAERIGQLEDVADVQTQRLEITEKHLSIVKSKSKVFARKCTEKEEQTEKLGSFCQTVKKQLLYTEERLQVAREEIAYLKAYAHLDTSFDEQSSSTIKSVAAQVNVIDDTHPTSAVQEETINTVAALAEKAAPSDEGAAFIVTVRPKDLAECWGLRFHDINLPGYNLDLQAIKEELIKEELIKKNSYRMEGGTEGEFFKMEKESN